MPIAIDPQTGQPVMLPDDEAAGAPPPGGDPFSQLLAGLPGPGGGGMGPPGMPPGMGPPGPPPGPEQAPPDFNGLVTDAMNLMSQAHGVARDEEEAETVLKVQYELQRLLTRQQKEARTAAGVSPQQKLMARGGFGG